MKTAIKYRHYSRGGEALQNLQITGDAEVASLLTATWDDPVGTETVQWYRADDDQGTNEEALNIANYSIYWPGSDDIGKYIRVGVTPSGGSEAFSSYTAAVTTIRVLYDDFNYGETIDIDKWEVVNPDSSIITIEQTLGCVLWTITSPTGVMGITNYIKSKSPYLIESGVVQADLNNTQTPSNNPVMFALHFDASNFIHVRRQQNNNNARLLITKGGTAVYDVNVSVTFNATWKIRYDANGDIYFYRLNTSTFVWEQQDTTQNAVTLDGSLFTGSAGIMFSVGANTSINGTGYIDEAYISTEDYNTIIPEMFLPPVDAGNALTTAYKAQKLGWFISEPYNYQYTSSGTDWTDARSQIDKPYDFEDFAAQAAAAGNVQYVVFKAKNTRGFRFWDNSDVQPYNGGVPHAYNGVTVPQYGFDYNIVHEDLDGLNIPSDYLQQGIDAFNAQGINVGLYYNPGQDRNFRNLVDWLGSGTEDDVFDEYMSLVENEMLDLLDKFTGFKYIWMDQTFSWYPVENARGEDTRFLNWWRLYNKIKRKNSNIVIIGNFHAPFNSDSLYTSLSLAYFPADVICVEESHLGAMDDSELSADLSNWKGTDYLVLKEILYSALFRDTNTVQYPWLQDEVFPGSDENKIYTQQEIQDQYDYAKSLGVPFQINIPIKHDGTLDTTYMSRVNGIVL